MLIATQIAAPATLAGDDDPSLFDDWGYIKLKARGVPLMSGKLEVRRNALDDGGEAMETYIVAKFMGAALTKRRTRTVIADDRGVELFLDMQGKRGRRYRFHDTGYEVEKMLPKKKPTTDLPPLGSDELPAWNITSLTPYDYPLDPTQGNPLPVYDHSMLMRLHELPLSPGESLEVRVATTEGPRSYEISLGEQRPGRRRLRFGKSKKRIDTQEAMLKVRPLDPEAKFLGMKGEVEVWVDAKTKTILSVSGKIPKVPGRVSLELVEIR